MWAPGRHVSRVPFRGLEGRPIRDVSRAEIASVVDDNAEEIANAEDSMAGSRAVARDCPVEQRRSSALGKVYSVG